jgi:SAM-dependent methyltransferase
MNTVSEEAVRNAWGGREKTWNLLRPPLRPGPQDIGYLKETIHDWQREQHGTPRLLLLGVTPEVYHLARAESARLLAADLSPEMIRIVWPGPKKDVICADWTRLPLEAGSRDIASCDGGFILMNRKREVDFVQSMGRVLSPGGRLLLRIFMTRNPPEKPEQILCELKEGMIGSVHELKLRLMSCDYGSDAGVSGREVCRMVYAAVPDLPDLATKLGWEAGSLVTLDTMRDSDIRYFQPTHEAVLARFTANPGGFTLLRVEKPDYAAGDQCPTYIFRRN